MRTEALREAIHSQPFRPFRLILTSGERLPVPHPEWVHVSPGGRTVFWADTSERAKVLDVALLVGVEMDEPAPSGVAQPEPDGGT